MSFSQILQPVIELAENGYPVYQRMHDRLEQFSERFRSLYPPPPPYISPTERFQRWAR
jgi:gamma-glutamyltranspeptidase